MGISKSSALLFTGLLATSAHAETSAEQVMASVNERAEASSSVRTFRLTMENARGQTLERTITVRRVKSPAVSKALLVYEAPSNLRGTSFLTHDHAEGADLQWLYLPALRRARQISASSRGDPFMGTDFTYEDIKKENKIELSDYSLELLSREDSTTLIAGRPSSPEIAEELGYGLVHWHVSHALNMPVRTEYWDTNLNPLKLITNEAIKDVDGISTPFRTTATSLISGHKTILEVLEASHSEKLDESQFLPARLRTTR